MVIPAWKHVSRKIFAKFIFFTLEVLVKIYYHWRRQNQGVKNNVLHHRRPLNQELQKVRQARLKHSLVPKKFISLYLNATPRIFPWLCCFYDFYGITCK